MRFEIKRIQKNLKVTTIFVTHDQTEALAMADRIVIMNKGRIEQIGTPTDVYFNPKTKFVSDFIGEMNFMPGTLIKKENSTAKVALSDFCHLDIPCADMSRLTQDVIGGHPPRKTIC